MAARNFSFDLKFPQNGGFAALNFVSLEESFWMKKITLLLPTARSPNCPTRHIATPKVRSTKIGCFQKRG